MCDAPAFDCAEDETVTLRNASVILDVNDYYSKVNVLLRNVPISKIEREITALFKSSNIRSESHS